jgi:hypothetical protein
VYLGASTYEKGGVVVASPVHLYNENFKGIGRASENLKKQDGDCADSIYKWYGVLRS